MFLILKIWVLLVLVGSLATCAIHSNSLFDYEKLTKKGFVNVRPNANMFWLLYHAAQLTADGYVKHERSEKFPTIIWLQGGPGGSSTGFGNFELIGPLDTDLNVRNSSWVQHANILFIDNPVGTGFSFVTQDDAFATNNEMIGNDLVALMQHFFFQNPDLMESDFYIFSESYGGKMAVSFVNVLFRAMQKGEIKCRLKGLVLGDPWISPFDSVSTWPQYLKSLSLIDEQQYKVLNQKMIKMKKLTKENQFYEATNYWSHLEAVIRNYTFHTSFYNVMDHDGPIPSVNSRIIQQYIKQNSKTNFDFFLNNLNYLYQNDLETLMNTQIKRILAIPDYITWGDQIVQVFNKLRADFMKPVVEDVNYILNNLPINVVVYNGQWDLIVNVLGTMNWVNRLQYTDAENFKNSVKKPFIKNDKILGFYKSYNKFSFYWIFKSGHMVPRDQSEAALEMLHNILTNK